MNNKLTGLRFATLLLPAMIAFGLTGCGSVKPTLVVESFEPESAPDLAAIEDQPDDAPISIVRDYPERHVVVKGDTLWAISKKFLKDPWLWPSVWHINPNIRNPHLIYPDDVIVMYIVDGKPYITLDGQAGVIPTATAVVDKKIKKPEIKKSGLKVVKLSPSSRTSKIHKAISTIPMNVIGPFLDRPRLVTEEQIEKAPYIVSSYEGHLISSSGNRIYVRNLTNPVSHYNVIRPGKEYVDPETGEVIGYEAIHLANAKLLRTEKDGEKPATLVLTKSYREVLSDDILIESEDHYQMFQFTPRAPEEKVNGQIMSVFNGVSQIGQYMIVVLNRGEDDGLSPGHVLAIMAKGEEAEDSRRFFMFNGVDLPNERAGVMMVFKTYKNISYALVMEAYRSMHIDDYFENP